MAEESRCVRDGQIGDGNKLMSFYEHHTREKVVRHAHQIKDLGRLRHLVIFGNCNLKALIQSREIDNAMGSRPLPW